MLNAELSECKQNFSLYWKKIVAISIVCIVGLFLELRSDFLSPENNLYALTKALQNNDKATVARLSTSNGLRIIRQITDNGTTLSELGNKLASEQIKGVLRHRNTRQEIILIGKMERNYEFYTDIRYVVFVPSLGGWKFNDIYWYVA